MFVSTGVGQTANHRPAATQGPKGRLAASGSRTLGATGLDTTKDQAVI